MKTYTHCPNCNRQLRSIPKAYKSPLVYRFLRWLQGFPTRRDSELLRACLEWLVIEGDGQNAWALVGFAWCSCGFSSPGAAGSNFWRGIHVMDSQWSPGDRIE